MKLILVRHGETDVNRAGLTLGRSDVGLNEKGHLQAQRLAQALKGRGIAAIYSSPLSRALETARAIGQALELPVQVEEDLIELDAGETERMNAQQLWERFPDFMRRWTSPEVASVILPGGSETLSQAQARAWRVVERLRQRHDNDTVVIVSHAFIILAILCHALGLDLGQFRRLHHDIAAISILELRPDRSILLSLNDTCHLEGLETALFWDDRRR